jgi:hypothetical protein
MGALREALLVIGDADHAPPQLHNTHGFRFPLIGWLKHRIEDDVADGA